MSSFQLKNFVISPSLINNSWKIHPLSSTNVSFPFPNTSKCSSNDDKISTLSIRSFSAKRRNNSIYAASSDAIQQQKQEEEEEEFRVVTAMRSNYNDIVIVDTADARMLLLDSSHNVHSMLSKNQKWTGSYWDDFASFPAIIPEGPIAILGLGAGTDAHLMLDLWPSLQLEGWEIDSILIDQARRYFGISDLEKPTAAGGMLTVHIGDAFATNANNSGKFAGIVVDFFGGGKVLSQLEEVATWLDLNDRLMPNCRFMVNCGAMDEKSDRIIYPQSTDGTRIENSTIKALSEVFPGQVNWKRTPETQGANYLAFTGPLPDLTLWSSKVPDSSSQNVKQWSPCSIL